MTDYQARSLKTLLHTERVNLLPSPNNEIWQTDFNRDDPTIFYWAKHIFCLRPGSTTLPVGQN